jgi:hypothetical protein
MLAAMPLSVSAHHSSAMFDSSRSLTLKGVVREFRWTNPHAFIQVVVKGGEGRDEEWSVEMSSPERLVRDGWRSDSLRAGDAVSLVVHPMRDDTNGGQYLSGNGPRGPLIGEPSLAPVSALTLSSADAISSCPRVELTRVEPSASSDTRPVKLGEETILVQRAATMSTH